MCKAFAPDTADFIAGRMQIKQKMTFESDTDTEVIPKLCMYVYNNLTEPLAFSEVLLNTYAPKTV